MFECPFSYWSRKTPKAIAIRGERDLTYLECDQKIQAIVLKLKNMGLHEGDRVAILPSIEPLTPLLFFALFRLSCVVCPLNLRLPKKGINDHLKQINAVFFIHNEKDKFCIPSVSFDVFMKLRSSKKKTVFLRKNALATFLFTSGSSAAPKIACHTLANHYYSALGSNYSLKLSERDRYLLSLPLFHIGGIAILFRSFLSGGSIVIGDSKAITFASFVPTQLYRLMQNKKMPYPKLRGILLGGAPISAYLYREGINQGLPLFPTYGMTEMSSQITMNNQNSLTLGHPLLYREIKIDDNEEILVRGKTLFSGYFYPHQGIEKPITGEGWFKTGDLASYRGKQGLKVIGRKDRLFISGGENIQPEEIEKALMQIPGIIEAYVTSIDDKEFGRRPIAYYHSDFPIESDYLIERLKQYFPKYKIPVAFHVLKAGIKPGFKGSYRY